VPAPVPSPTPAPATGFNETCADPDAERLSINFEQLAPNVDLDDPDQLKILREAYGIVSITAIKDDEERDVNVKNDPVAPSECANDPGGPNSTCLKLVFIESRDGGNTQGGCMTIQFNKLSNNAIKGGVVLTNMILAELDDGTNTVKVSDECFSFHVNVTKRKLTQDLLSLLSIRSPTMKKKTRQPFRVLIL
jgi:hypothetical protein